MFPHPILYAIISLSVTHTGLLLVVHTKLARLEERIAALRWRLNSLEGSEK